MSVELWKIYKLLVLSFAKYQKTKKRIKVC